MTMAIPVILTIKSEQRYEGMEPDMIELVTDGEMCREGEDVWEITYTESALTGLEGVQTTFHISPEKVVLNRTGTLESLMVFEEKTRHDSLYQMEFGALMLGVITQRIQVELSEEGGFLEVQYGIHIEQNQAGTVLYHVDVKRR